MSLSPQERLILATCEMEADLTISEISKRSRIAEHIVHLVSTRGFHQALRDTLLAFARSEPCCNTFRSFVGRWDLLFECHYQSSKESLEFVERLLAAHGAEISGVETLSVLAHEKGTDCTVTRA